MLSSYSLLRPADPLLEQLYLTLCPLKRLLASQCVFIAFSCQRVQLASIARAKVQYAYTWEKRLTAYFAASNAMSSDPSDGASDWRFRIGIIGGGCMGGYLAYALLGAGFHPSQLVVASRTPARQKDLASRGVHVVTDVESVVRFVHILFLCVLPIHLAEVAKAMRKALAPHILTFSLLAGVRHGPASPHLTASNSMSVTRFTAPQTR